MRQLIENNQFGILTSAGTDERGNVCIRNAEGKVLRMTTKYPERWEVLDKANGLLGKKVKIYTSQTTNSWSHLQWFCDLQEIK